MAEMRRTYYFPGGRTVVFHNVTEVSEKTNDGRHWIKCGGRMHSVVRPGWIAIKVENKEKE